jgi:hypothetical protein
MELWLNEINGTTFQKHYKGFVDLQGNHYTQCQPEVAHPSGRSISVGTIEMKYCRLTNLDVLDSCKITILLIWQNDKSGLLKTILEVKILKMVCWTCLPYFYEWKCWNPSKLVFSEKREFTEITFW